MKHLRTVHFSKATDEEDSTSSRMPDLVSMPNARTNLKIYKTRSKIKVKAGRSHWSSVSCC